MWFCFQLDFWKEPTVKGEDVHVMVAEDLMSAFGEQLKSRGFKWHVMIDDVGE